MKEILQYLFGYNTLSYEEAKSIMLQIPQGVFNDAEITSFITVMMMRSIRIEELSGFSDALIEMAHPIDLGTNDLVDIVGTGGDGKNTFNISTLACFVVAGAGQKVAKHGNYGSSSVSGASNVMAHMGYEFTNDPTVLRQQLQDANICFMHAPKFHPSLGKVAPIRKNLGFRTFFNMIGPLVNPAKPAHSLLGVYNLEMGRIYSYLLQRRAQHFMVVHSLEGYDEISLTGESVIITEKGTQLLNPSELLSQKVTPKELYGGKTTEEAAQLFKNILEGRGTAAQNEVVITNAALALKNTDKFGSYATCRALAEESLMAGKALNSLNQLINR
uniref:anthranilate phosphoribosyltransferase n=1 Tax=Ornithobacterium rhinotracheale TaxID=28251 RepID=UPI0039A567CF